MPLAVGVGLLSLGGLLALVVYILRLAPDA